jgi:molybdopterin/thiamine biosynthesis adenylyltransferase
MLRPQQNLEDIVKQLKTEGYNVATADESVFITWDIPYLNAAGSIRRGILAFPIGKSNDIWMPVNDHSAYFKGEIPFNLNGKQLPWIISTSEQWNIAGGIGIAKIRMSCKKTHPENTVSTYKSIEEKLKNYIRLIEIYAKRKNPLISAQTFGDPPDLKPVGPFLFPDSASSRNGIGNLNDSFVNKKIGIIGLGGTGSYILDLVAKTHVLEIHLYDSDIFDCHNSFRAPGAASIEEIDLNELKVTRYSKIYGKFRNGIIPHEIDISSEKKAEIEFLDFIFIAIDNETARREICVLLENINIPYIDVGMFAQLTGNPNVSLGARTRTTFWYPNLPKKSRLNILGERENDDDYSSNIQIAEMNSLNASLAVIRWKKYMKYYNDFEKEKMSIYDSNKNSLVNIKRPIGFKVKIIKLVPKYLQEGILYISLKYKTASHLCPCGCKHKIVTPFGENGWRLSLILNRASLYPSIGNRTLECKSHYWIKNNKIIWAFYY